jgi:ArsR family transcriptional regulator
MDNDEERLLALERDIASLQERVVALEVARNLTSLSQSPSLPSADFGTLHLMQSRQGSPYEQDGKSGAVIYAGAAHITGREYSWQVERPVPWLLQLLGSEPEILSQVFAALGSPLRLILLQELLLGPRTNQQLQEALGVSSAGQLYHHLKELLTVGLIEQKSRNLYVLPVRNVIPFLVLLATARDTTGKE